MLELNFCGYKSKLAKGRHFIFIDLLKSSIEMCLHKIMKSNIQKKYIFCSVLKSVAKTKRNK